MVECPRCTCPKIYSIRRNRLRCSACRCEFSETSGTPLHAHKKPAEWYRQILALRATGMNARQISKHLGGDYKWIWLYIKKREISTAASS